MEWKDICKWALEEDYEEGLHVKVNQVDFVKERLKADKIIN